MKLKDVRTVGELQTFGMAAGRALNTVVKKKLARNDMPPGYDPARRLCHCGRLTCTLCHDEAAAKLEGR